MIGREFRFHDGKKGAALAIRLSLGKKNNKIKKVLKDGTVAVELAGKPERPRKELIRYLSEELKIEINDFDLIEGKEGADILLSILNVTPEEIRLRVG